MNKTERMYVKGTIDNAKEFTVDLMWYHSAAAEIGSTNRNDDDTITLNLIVDPERRDCVERWAAKFNMVVVG